MWDTIQKAAAAPNPEERATALRMVGDLKDVRGLSILLEAMTNTQPSVRGAAASALGDLGKVQGIPALEQALNDKIPAVKTSAAISLGELGVKESLVALRKSLDDPNPVVKAAVVSALLRVEETRTTYSPASVNFNVLSLAALELFFAKETDLPLDVPAVSHRNVSDLSLEKIVTRTEFVVTSYDERTFAGLLTERVEMLPATGFRSLTGAAEPVNLRATLVEELRSRDSSDSQVIPCRDDFAWKRRKFDVIRPRLHETECGSVDMPGGGESSLRGAAAMFSRI